MAVKATMEVSASSVRRIISGWKPMARSIPSCWRRSTTARALMTPRAATPTTRPSAMNPWTRRMNSMLAPTWSSRMLGVGLGLDAAGEQRRLDGAGDGGGVGPVADGEVVDGGQRPLAERGEHLLGDGDAGHRHRGVVAQHADDRELEGGAGERVVDDRRARARTSPSSR